MLAAFALIAAAVQPVSLDLTPTDDVWVYAQASDAKDPYLRVWGSGGDELAASASDMEQFSYSYLRFDVSKAPAGKITSAKLVLTHIANPSFSLDQATKNPVVARPLVGDFTEKTWDYSQIDRVKPETTLKSVFGTGAPASAPAEDKEFTLFVDLLKGPNDFAAALRKAQGTASKSLALSLSSSMDVSGGDKRTFYKFFSKDAESPAKRPVLKLTVEP